MRYSTKSLLILVGIVALPFGAHELYQSAWESHRRKLEPLLFNFVLQQEFHSVSEPDTEFDFSVDGIEYTGDLATDIKRPTIYFAIGMRKDDGLSLIHISEPTRPY